MTQHYSILTLLACASLIPLLSACGANSGYYDDKGNYVHADTPYTKQKRHSYDNSPENRPYSDRYYYDNRPYYYDRPGYYDYNGYYVDRPDNLRVPDDMLPPRGKCRVWFVNRAPSDQPAIESCNRIKTRVPAGSYVIYGG